jgi:serine/threonine-protein kinase 24/25/MST4
MTSSITTKGELPPLPPSASSTPSRYSDHQATVRNVPGEPAVAKNGPVQREPLDEYEDYGAHYEDAYTSHSQILQEDGGQAPIEDELPDTTMLDSVILPAIASVRYITRLRFVSGLMFVSCVAFPSCVNARRSRRPQCPSARIYRS